MFGGTKAVRSQKSGKNGEKNKKKLETRVENQQRVGEIGKPKI